MPYIPSHQRVRLDAEIDALADKLNGFPRELLDGAANYALTRLLKDTFLRPEGAQGEYHPVGYRDHAGAQAVLACVGHELYRRETAPYEDAKRSLNGDV